MTIATSEKDPVKIVQAIQQLEQGRSNATGICKLTAGATTTVVVAPNCGAGSKPSLTARTANAAAALATTYVSAVGNGSFTLTHANNAQTDRDFFWTAFG